MKYDEFMRFKVLSYVLCGTKDKYIKLYYSLI